MKLFILSLLTVGGLLLGVLIAVRQGNAQGSIDLSGSQWAIHVTGALDQMCTASIIQNAAEISAHIICYPLGEGDFRGTIDQKTGAFAVSGQIDVYPVSL